MFTKYRSQKDNEHDEDDSGSLDVIESSLWQPNSTGQVVGSSDSSGEEDNISININKDQCSTPCDVSIGKDVEGSSDTLHEDNDSSVIGSRKTNCARPLVLSDDESEDEELQEASGEELQEASGEEQEDSDEEQEDSGEKQEDSGEEQEASGTTKTDGDKSTRVKSRRSDCLATVVVSDSEDEVKSSKYLEKLYNTEPIILSDEENKEYENVPVEKQADEVIDLISDLQIDNSEQKNSMLAEKQRLQIEINQVKIALEDKKRMLNFVDLNSLPDKGMRLKDAVVKEESALDKLKEQMSRVKGCLESIGVNPEENLEPSSPAKMKENTENRLPKFGYLPSANIEDMGRKALETHRVEQALTVDALCRLHKSLKTCPAEGASVSDPSGLKVPLLQHQKEGLGWLTWRETQKPMGGILADDMGLGKTLSMIALVLKSREDRSEDDSTEEESDDETESVRRPYKGGTLVICPASIVGQWESEVKDKTSQGLLDVQIYHGQSREKKGRRLARLDVVITSYNIVRVEGGSSKQGNKPKGTLFRVQWERIVLDEAHIIRNYRSQTAVAVHNLCAKRRWALTGTPIHNKEQDLFSIIKYLRCAPFNDLNVWKKWIESKDSTGTDRLNTVTKSLMLRRTKDMLMSEGKLDSLPEKTAECIVIKLNSDEQKLYEEVLNFSTTLLSQFIYQRAEKENLLTFGLDIKRNKKNQENPFTGHPVLEKLWYKVNTMQNVKSHEILVLLLRLRQICNHPALMKGMLEKEAMVQDQVAFQDEEGGNEEDAELLERMSALNVNDTSEGSSVFSLANPIFNPQNNSSKITAVLNLLEERIVPTEEKVVIVSQWSTMLDLIRDALLSKGWKCLLLTGKVPVEDRTEIVERFNKKANPKILLLSLTAGGTGLNLVGGNHLMMIDPHWNPQLESQACDRVYRFGQKKPVVIYRLICAETIEERIQTLQKNKLELANAVLAGARNVQAAKLTMDDLKMIFNVK